MHPDTDASTSPPFEPAISSLLLLLLLLLLLYAFVKLSLCAGSGESRSRKEEFTREHKKQTRATAVAAHRSSATITTDLAEKTPLALLSFRALLY
jgi:CBS domain containing-hemolysin-like protein